MLVFYLILIIKFILFTHYFTQDCQQSGKSQGKKYFLQVREMSGNFVQSQGILGLFELSGKCQGILSHAIFRMSSLLLFEGLGKYCYF